MTLPKSGFFEFIRGLISDVSKNVYAVIIVCLIVSNYYFIKQFVNCKNDCTTKILKVQELRLEDKDILLNYLLPDIKRAVKKEVRKQNEEVIQSVEKTTKTLEELTNVITNEKK